MQQNSKRRGEKTKVGSEQGQEERQEVERSKKQHEEQTVTELEMVENERKKRKKQKKKEKRVNVQAEMEERTEGKTKKKSNDLQTQRDDGATVAEEAMSSWRKNKYHNDRRTEDGKDSGLSASAVDVSDVRVPEEARRSKKKHKNRRTELGEGAESRHTVLRLADDPEIIELYTDTVEGGENVVTEQQNNVKEKRKRKKEKIGEIQLNVCPDETELPGIIEQTERKWKTMRLTTQPDGGSAAVEGSRRKKRERSRESDTGMDRVPSTSDNGTPDAGPEPETGEDGPHTTMVATRTQHRRRSLKEKPLSEKERRAMNELKEFIPNIESHAAWSIRAMIKYDLDRFKGFRRQGIEDASKLFHTTRFTDEVTKIQRLKSQHSFPERIVANLGSWSEEELKRLMEAVRDHLLGQAEPGSGPATIRKDKLYNHIPWSDVCRKVKTRHRDQCRMKWFGILAHKMTYGRPVFSGGVKTIKAKVDLIKALNAMQVEDASDVDWEEIAHTIGGVTPYYLQMHYHKLKVTKVPLRESMTFCEIIDFLYSSVLPQFEELLRQVQTESGETESGDEPRELFLLSEIFEND
ncbi:unnamed protein product [Coregonus sp. 'balchen']|nr:unnamed protein product [Coregonus sp. 'balchen']